MATESGGPLTLTGFGEPVQLRGAQVGAHYFNIFGIKPILGRTFAPDEDQRGKEKVAVLSHVRSTALTTRSGPRWPSSPKT
jgi:hypothetical protein